jgi:nuclear pore complex protein Nup93
MSSVFGGQSQSQSQPTSNIFGNPGGTASSSAQSQPAQTSSLFNSSQPLQARGLFPDLNTSKPPSSPSLFSNLGKSTSQGPSGLFGTAASSQPQQSGFSGFSGSTAAATSQPQQRGPFETSWDTPAASSQPQQGGPFGTLGGTTAASSQPQPQQGGGFGSFNTNQTQTQQQSGQPSQSNGATLHSAYFNSLLEKNRKRDRAAAENESGFGEIPSLQLGLGDIAKRARELGGTAVSNLAKSTDSKAHYLLAASGVNPGAALRDLNAFNAQASSTTGPQPRSDWDPDSHKHVEQLMQQSTMKMIQEGISLAHRQFDAFIEENVDIDWNAQRQKLYEHFGLLPQGGDKLSDSTHYATLGGKGSFARSSRGGRGPKAGPDRQGTPARSIFGKSGMQKSVIGTPGLGSDNASVFKDVTDKSSQGPGVQDDRFLREKQGKFADKVQRLNEARLQELAYPVLHEFVDVEGQPGGDVSSSQFPAETSLLIPSNSVSKPAS